MALTAKELGPKKGGRQFNQKGYIKNITRKFLVDTRDGRLAVRANGIPNWGDEDDEHPRCLARSISTNYWNNTDQTVVTVEFNNEKLSKDSLLHKPGDVYEDHTFRTTQEHTKFAPRESDPDTARPIGPNNEGADVAVPIVTYNPTIWYGKNNHPELDHLYNLVTKVNDRFWHHGHEYQWRCEKAKPVVLVEDELLRVDYSFSFNGADKGWMLEWYYEEVTEDELDDGSKVLTSEQRGDSVVSLTHETTNFEVIYP